MIIAIMAAGIHPEELERISGGGQASPKFRGGPNPGEMPEFQMSRPSAAINHE